MAHRNADGRQERGFRGATDRDESKLVHEQTRAMIETVVAASPLTAADKNVALALVHMLTTRRRLWDRTSYAQIAQLANISRRQSIRSIARLVGLRVIAWEPGNHTRHELSVVRLVASDRALSPENGGASDKALSPVPSDRNAAELVTGSTRASDKNGPELVTEPCHPSNNGSNDVVHLRRPTSTRGEDDDQDNLEARFREALEERGYEARVISETVPEVLRRYRERDDVRTPLRWCIRVATRDVAPSVERRLASQDAEERRERVQREDRERAAAASLAPCVHDLPSATCDVCKVARDHRQRVRVGENLDVAQFDERKRAYRSFLADHPELIERDRSFLKMYPECDPEGLRRTSGAAS